jgi:hypothetical protein
MNIADTQSILFTREKEYGHRAGWLRCSFRLREVAYLKLMISSLAVYTD